MLADINTLSIPNEKECNPQDIIKQGITILLLSFGIESSVYGETGFEIACQKLVSGVSIHTSQGVVRNEFFPLGKINKLSKEYKGAYWVEGHIDLAWTLVTWDNSVEYDFHFITEKTGEACATPDVRISLSLKDILVAIAQEVTDNSCILGEVLDHENKHVAIYNDILEKAPEDIRRNILQRIKGKVFRGNNQEEAFLQGKDYLDEIIGPIISEIIEDYMKKHDEIDTKEEYIRFSRICGGKVWKVIGGNI